MSSLYVHSLARQPYTRVVTGAMPDSLATLASYHKLSGERCSIATRCSRCDKNENTSDEARVSAAIVDHVIEC